MIYSLKSPTIKTIILLLTIIVAPIKQDSLVNTIWTYKVANGCIDKLEFKPNHLLNEYDCELDYNLKGTYKLSADTLFMVINDDSHSEDGGKITRYRSKCLIRNNALYTITTGEMIKGTWKDKAISSKTPGYRKIK